MSCLRKCKVHCWIGEKNNNNNYNVKVFLLPCWSSSERLKGTNEISRAFRLTYISSLSYARSQYQELIRQKGSIVVVLGAGVEEEKKNNERKKTTTTRWLPSSLLSSLWAAWIPNCSSLWGAHPHPSFPQCKVLGESRGLVWEGERRGGWKPVGRGEEGGCSTASHPLRLTSANHQSRCWWRFRLRTERTSAVNLEEGEQVLAFNSSGCRGWHSLQYRHRHTWRSAHSVDSVVSP